MTKNIVIAALALLCIGLFFYGLMQNIEARKQKNIATEQTAAALRCKEQAEAQMKAAQKAFELAKQQVAMAELRAEQAEHKK